MSIRVIDSLGRMKIARNSAIPSTRIPYGDGTSEFATSSGFVFDGTTETVPQLQTPDVRISNGGGGANGLFRSHPSLDAFELGGLNATANLQFITNATERVRITAAGVLSVLTGQILFPATQNASSDVNTLDDYEEGSWTPVIGGSGGTSGQTYTFQAGNYIKTGRVVVVQFGVVLSAKGTITSSVQIQNLPFTVVNDNSMGVGALRWANLGTNWVDVSLQTNANATTANVRGTTAAAASNTTDLVAADIANNSEFRGTLVYLATA